MHPPPEGPTEPIWHDDHREREYASMITIVIAQEDLLNRKRQLGVLKICPIIIKEIKNHNNVVVSLSHCREGNYWRKLCWTTVYIEDPRDFIKLANFERAHWREWSMGASRRIKFILTTRAYLFLRENTLNYMQATSWYDLKAIHWNDRAPIRISVYMNFTIEARSRVPINRRGGSILGPVNQRSSIQFGEPGSVMVQYSQFEVVFTQ